MAVTYDGSGVPTGNTARARYAYSTVDFDSGNYSRLNKITYPDGTDYEQYYGDGLTPSDINDDISRLTRMRVGTTGSDTVKYRHVGLGMVEEVDYPVPDIQLDRTVSHDGKRNNQGFTSQTSGIYPGWDRFGRVKKQAWVDGAYTTGTGSNPSIPPLVEIDYTYDRSSNRLTRTDARPGASWADRDFRYEYDGLNRLVQADRGAQGGSWSHAVGGQKWALDMLGNWDSISTDSDGSGTYTTSSPDEQEERTHNFANEIEDITSLPFAYDAAGNMTEQDLTVTSTKYYSHDAWNRLTEVKVDTDVLGEYEYNALHWRTVKRSRTPGGGSIDEMRLMYYSANWQLVEERIDRSWTSGFTEDERAQTFWGKRYIDDAVARRRDRDANGTYDNNFFYVTDAQFSTVAMVSASNARIVERVTYDSYGKARHHFGGDVTGDGAATQAADDAALVATINAGSNSIGQSNYKAEQDLNRDGTISSADRQTLAALTGNADQAALASGLVSFVTTGSGGSTVHGPDNSAAWDGYGFSPESGQYYVRSRWYDSVLGRWLERDPYIYVDGSSLFQYTRSAPTGSTDPWGLWCMKGCKAQVNSDSDTLWGLATIVYGDGAKWSDLGYSGDPTKLTIGTEVDLCNLVSSWYNNVDAYLTMFDKSVLALQLADRNLTLAAKPLSYWESFFGASAWDEFTLTAGFVEGALGSQWAASNINRANGWHTRLNVSSRLLSAAGIALSVNDVIQGCRDGNLAEIGGGVTSGVLGGFSLALSTEAVSGELGAAGTATVGGTLFAVGFAGSSMAFTLDKFTEYRTRKAALDQLVQDAAFLTAQADRYNARANALRPAYQFGLERLRALSGIPECPCEDDQ